MGKQEKTMCDILSGRCDKNIRFSDAVALLQALGFSMRVRGDHHIFYKQGIEEIVNLQPAGGKAKPYQIKQIRNLITKYELEAPDAQV